MAHYSSADKSLLAKLAAAFPLTGEGSPEGKVQALPGRQYVDTTTTDIYVKATGSGSDGWQLK